jgi:hypothetical protein
MTGPSLRQAINLKCRDCGAAGAGARWREHVTICPAIVCSLWPVRPMSRYVPEFLARRDAAALPAGWISQTEEDALRQLRNGAFTPSEDTETLSRSAMPTICGAIGPNDSDEPAGHCHVVMAAGKDWRVG